MKGKRHHVHLSLQQATAINVGGRHGAPVVLTVRAGDMHRAGFEFYCSESGVWLTEMVPAAYIVDS
ncbi:MAG: RNA 2'-phosphotransferase [Bacteroidota bacterium]